MSSGEDYLLDGKHYQNQWLELSNDLRMWAFRSSELLLAADTLHGPRKRGFEPRRGERELRIARNGTVLGATMMLYGMSLESLMKAVAVQNGHCFAIEVPGSTKLRFQSLFTESWKNHDLIELSTHERISISPFSDDEKSLARRLTPYITWGARYPSAKKWDDGLGPLSEGDWLPDMAWDFFNDHRVVHKFADRLFEGLGVTRGPDKLVILPNV